MWLIEGICVFVGYPKNIAEVLSRDESREVFMYIN